MSRKDFHFPEDGFRPIPNWVFNVAIDGKIDAFDCAIYSVIANVNGTFKWNLAGLVNRFKRRKVESSIKRLLVAGLISVEKISKTELKYTAFDQEAYNTKKTTMAETYIDYGGNVHSTTAETYIALCTKTPSKKSTKKRIKKSMEKPSRVQVDKSPSPGGHSAQEVISLWNTITAGLLPKVIAATPKRAKAILGRSEILNGVTWEDVFKSVARSDLLTGKVGSGWTADFDWVMKPDNLVKILEGNYNNRDSGIIKKTNQEDQLKKRDELNEKY